MKTSDRIKMLREKRGFTLDELGKQVGVQSAAVSKWERGVVGNIKKETVVKLANALNTTPAFLMGWEEDSEKQDYYYDKEVAQKAQELYDDPDTRVLLDAKRNLTKEDLETLLHVMKSLEKK